MRQRTGSTPRAGFTLIELLVVIAIIAVLVALTLAGIGYARNSARQVQTTNDVRGLDAAVTDFKAKFGFAPPAYMIETAANGNRYLRRFRVPTRIDQPEYAIMHKMFGRSWDPANQGGLLADNVTIAPAFLPARAGEDLDANQVLVYFLGGPNNQGWSTAGPRTPTGNSKYGPFFEFPVGDQLVSMGTAAPRFLDLNGIPYAYFTSNTDNDRFDERAQFPWTSGGTQAFAWGTGIEVAPASFDPTADPLAASTKTVHPLRSPNGKWLAAGRWQIIAAGKDKQFGYGSPMLPTSLIADYTPGTGAYNLKQPGDDDISNFSGSNLGVGN